MAVVARLPHHRTTPSLAEAVEVFLTQPDLLDRTVRTYRATLALLVEDLGPATLLDEVDAEQIEQHLENRFGGRSASYYNRNRAAVSSLFAFAVRKRWVVENVVADVARRRQRTTLDRALRLPELEAVWSDPAVPLRERTLWVLLYETAARASEILDLNVEDCDLVERQATITGKGGGQELVFWATTSARLLDRLLDGRTSGPIFVGDRRPRQPQPHRDLSPDGYARLSYRRAEQLFVERTGWTLHQLRHSALTHLAEDGVDVSLLKAKSRHASLRSLEVYLHPSTDSVKRLTADHDRLNRRAR